MQCRRILIDRREERREKRVGKCHRPVWAHWFIHRPVPLSLSLCSFPNCLFWSEVFSCSLGALVAAATHLLCSSAVCSCLLCSLSFHCLRDNCAALLYSVPYCITALPLLVINWFSVSYAFRQTTVTQLEESSAIPGALNLARD